MRVIGGKYKGRSLLSFDGFDIRPTSDRARESLFNILQFDIIEKTFLDLFCGTGAMGIEALSRGAKRVVFNDNSKKSLSLTKANLEKLKVSEDYKLTNFNGEDYLKSTTELFDIIFLDPPYNLTNQAELIELALNKITPDGVVIFESENKIEEIVLGGQEVDFRKYGRAYLTFYKKV